MEQRSDVNSFDTRSSVLTAIQDLGSEGNDSANSPLLQYLEMYSTLKPQSTVGEQDLLALLQGLSTRSQTTSSTEEHRETAQASSSGGRYSQIYQLSSTPEAHRRMMIVADLVSDTTDQTLVEYFRRFGLVTDVKMYTTKDNQGPPFAVLRFFTPVSVNAALRLKEHPVDGKAVTCAPYQVDRVVKAIPWKTSNSMVEKAREW